MADAFLGTVLPAIPAHRCGTAEEVRHTYIHTHTLPFLAIPA